MQVRIVREIRLLRAMRRGWKRDYGVLYPGTKEETPDTDKGSPSGLPRQPSTLPLFWNALDLERKLADFQSYFNEYRVHSSLLGRQRPKSAKDRFPAAPISPVSGGKPIAAGSISFPWRHEYQFGATRGRTSIYQG